MHHQNTCFTPFSESIANYTLPARFTFPFCYEPHPLCLLASNELQQQLLADEKLQLELEQNGKMFGVLLVKNEQGEIGYLSANSGKALHQLDAINLVPSIVSFDVKSEFFHRENTIINKLNTQVEQLMANPLLMDCQAQLEALHNQQEEQLKQFRNQMSLNKKARKVERSQASEALVADELAQRLKQLAQESVNDKNQLRDIKKYWQDVTEKAQKKLDCLTNEIEVLKKQRKQLSTKLQKKLFKQYRLLNSAGVEQNLMEIFQSAPYPIPPAGTGDCAAPKLLQYAFKHQLKPLAMAEFWWGKSPKSEIRQHKNFCGACSGKCQPVLAHMLAGMDVDENPLLKNPAQGKALPIVYQDNDMVVVNKPSEFLSVPGKNVEDSVYLRIKQQFPHATGSLIVHRLDMSTSGLMVLALTKRAQKNLQQQFVNRSIKKRYLAVLEGNIEKVFEQSQGEIHLPLRGDFEDRPRQLVCFEHGKKAKTQWQVIDTIDDKTKLYLYPETGRTHQLRVHCAHPKGLNMPIFGDDLYGCQSSNEKAHRLHLHAQMLTLSHPITKALMTFEAEADF
jgi:tRNA pseudouridine32 synthase/23S rRNA pseudouridine746 synthase